MRQEQQSESSKPLVPPDSQVVESGGTGDLASATDIPTRVFERFLDALRESGEDSALISQFRKTLLEDRVFTDRALQDAQLPQEPKA
jgi:hypothetical protein